MTKPFVWAHLVSISAFTAIVSGCTTTGSVGTPSNQKAYEALAQRLVECMKVQIPQKTSAQCALNLYNDVQALPESDVDRTASLKMAVTSYGLFSRYDKGQISWADMPPQITLMQQEYRRDLDEARRRNYEQNLQIARQRQQAFLDLYKALNPPRNGISCYAQNQGFITTLNCN